MVNIPPVIFIGGPTKQGITGNIQGAWDLDKSVAVVTFMCVTVEEALSYIGINSRIEVISL